MFINTGSGGSSRSRAGHLIRSAFLASPIQEMEFSGPLPKIDKLSNVWKHDTYRGCQIVAVKAGVVRHPWPRLLLLEEQLPDPFVRHAKELL